MVTIIKSNYNLEFSYETTDEVNVITPPNFRRRFTITDVISDDLNSPEARNLSNCRKMNQFVTASLARSIILI